MIQNLSWSEVNLMDPAYLSCHLPTSFRFCTLLTVIEGAESQYIVLFDVYQVASPRCFKL